MITSVLTELVVESRAHPPPATILSSEVLVFVSDGEERTIMRSINFVEGVILITTKSYTVGSEGGTVKIDLSTNLDYTVEIPEADQTWISVAKIESRAAMRDETITLNVAANPTPAERHSKMRLVDACGITGETILSPKRQEQTIPLSSISLMRTSKPI